MSVDATYAARRLPKVYEASVSERVAFIRRTYFHLAGAIVAFVALEAVLIQTGLAGPYLDFVFAASANWLVILGLFMIVGHVADGWARSERSRSMQYLGLSLYIAAEALLFLPLLAIATYYSDPLLVPSAGLVTLTTFGGLSAVVLVTKKDFSFLRMGLALAGLLALGLIVAAILFGFELGVLFSLAMVGLASGYIVYYTSNVLHHYRTDQHVAAALSLFASIALMFWYILRLFLILSGDD
ncbi:MAG: Bax inhibitor-1 family protein [Candidatus Promineifilaceae bacterium]|nr:Bax inhibitor-1 family protein [Candidatus Promineifilaceae bacterium]